MADKKLRLREIRRRIFGTVNDELLDRLIQHAIYLERFKNGQVRAILEFLNAQVFPDIVHRVLSSVSSIQARGPEVNTEEQRRLQQMALAIRAQIATGTRTAYAQLSADMKALALTEARFAQSMLNAVVPLDFDWKSPSPALLRSIVTTRPMNGRPLKKWWQSLGDDLAARTEQAINVGMAQGEHPLQIVRRVRGTKALKGRDGVLGISRRHAATVVNTAVAHTTNHAREEVYNANADLMKGYAFRATLDSKTSIICASLDGQVFKPGEGPMPPLHPNCRSVRAPVVKSLKELGFDVNEAPVGVRASMDGQVPADLSYPQWLRGKPREFQNEVLGKRRAELWRSGKVSFDRFTNDRQQVLTLEQLAQREGIKI